MNPLPELTAEEYAALKVSIAERGVLTPAVVSSGPACTGEVGDGFHRIRACGELGIECPVERRPFESEADFRLYQLDVNVKRRQLTVAQRIELGMAREPWERKLARERQGHGQTAPGRNASRSPTRSVKSSEATAAAVGLKPSTYERGAKVLREAPAELADKLRQGDVTVNSAYLELRNQQRREQSEKAPAPAMPDGTYDVILADPPWRYEGAQTERRAIENQYPTMSVEDICALSPPAADDCVLFLWGTAPKLPEALQVIDAWGFTYRTCMVWVKDRIGMGYYARGRHELLLIAKRGNASPPTPDARPDSVIQAPRAAHSAKPNESYDVIEAMYPGARRIELFCRTARPGWDAWGNEVAA